MLDRLSNSLAVALMAALLLLQGCHDQPAPTEAVRSDRLAAQVTASETARYIVVFAAERVDANFGDRVARLGGGVEASLDAIGVAIVTGLTEAAALELASEQGIAHVEPDAVTTPLHDDVEPAALVDQVASEALAPADATASPTSAQFYARQWNMRAVLADRAWAAGHLGARDVVVAILDSGIDYLHPDLAGLVDLERSKSFVPEPMPARYADRLPISDLHQHGTFVSSIVASNATIVAGINRYVTLLAVKINDSTRASTPGRFLTGIVYAADQGADVINISDGREFDKSESPGTIAAFERAVNYAFRKGALLVTVPLRNADLDHNGNLVRLPCEAANAICVAATAPTAGGSVNGPWQSVDAPAPYTAVGRSAIDVAAPGGLVGAGIQFRGIWLPCTTTPTVSSGRCPVGRLVAESSGNSFAAPTVAGLAALLVAQLGKGNPALIRAKILESADDLGEPGTDPSYGKGRINIARALGVVH